MTSRIKENGHNILPFFGVGDKKLPSRPYGHLNGNGNNLSEFEEYVLVFKNSFKVSVYIAVPTLVVALAVDNLLGKIAGLLH